MALHAQNPEMHHLRSAKMVNVCHAEHARLQRANLLELRHIFMLQQGYHVPMIHVEMELGLLRRLA